MNEVDWIKSLDQPSPDVPKIDVTAGVMRAVRSIRREDAAVFSIAAIFAAVAGVAAIALALPVWFAAQDPLAGFADAFDVVLK
jgi:hypothetical protein